MTFFFFYFDRIIPQISVESFVKNGNTLSQNNLLSLVYIIIDIEY